MNDNTRRILTAAAAAVIAPALCLTLNAPAWFTAIACLLIGHFCGAGLARLTPRNACQVCEGLRLWPIQPAIGTIAKTGKLICREHARHARTNGQMVIEVQQPIPFGRPIAGGRD